MLIYTTESNKLMDTSLFLFYAENLIKKKNNNGVTLLTFFFIKKREKFAVYKPLLIKL